MNTYLPYEMLVSGVEPLSDDSILLTMKFKNPSDERSFNFIAGQFIELSLAGFGEIPVGIASAPYDKKHIQVSVRKVGNVSAAVHRMEVGDTVGIRGPFGNGFKPDWLKGMDLVVVSGGCGIPPMRSLILDVLDHRDEYGDVKLLYGSRTQQDLLFRKEYKKWAKNIDVRLTVDKDENRDSKLKMDCGVGVVTGLLDGIKLTANTVAVMCGPPIMYKFVGKKLIDMGLSADRIYVSLERRMKCGIGKCQHCTSGSRYVCIDGPVFTYKQVMEEYGGL
jgi:sulfhydrogenase subunit gamma (sulfur reductase)